jgi:hypothetical protein
VFKVTEDSDGTDGQPEEEQLELWYRDPIECLEQLFGNPAFRDCIAYAPQKVYTTKAGTTRMYDEMWTGIGGGRHKYVSVGHVNNS